MLIFGEGFRGQAQVWISEGCSLLTGLGSGDSNYLYAAYTARSPLGALDSRHIRPRAHDPGTRISQQRALFTEPYLGLTAQPPPRISTNVDLSSAFANS